MAQQKLSDVVIVLPGISGSLLRRNGKEIWSPSAGAAWRMLAGAKELTLDDEPGDPNKLAGGVEATALSPDIHILPGLWKIDGYSAVVNAIERAFVTRKAQTGEDKLANLILFPYDWRRDNAINAQRLASVAGGALARWRRETPNKNARLILIAHSMGGLISRYYLDVLGGYQDCRALITFGTPFRGSLNAVDTLANGVRKAMGLVDLTDALRSMPSVYQLMPRYECVLDGKSYRRVAECDSLPAIVQTRAKDALGFYLSIDKGVKDRSDVLPYQILPYAGINQSTQQSAEFEEGSLRVVGLNPPKLPDAYEDGDGTVPLVSAIPAEMSDKGDLVSYINERHASLQNNTTVLNDAMKRLIAMQVPGLGNLLGGLKTRTAALEMQVDDVYGRSEPVMLPVRPKEALTDPVVTATLQNAATGTEASIPVTKTDNGWVAAAGKLDPGTYRVEARVDSEEASGSVRDVFAVQE